MTKQETKKLTLLPLILMIFTFMYGFAYIPQAFYLFGYSAIVWYVLGAILFFIPYTLMIAEYGSAFKKEKSGIYSWLKYFIGEKFAFIGIFTWFVSYLVWQANIATSIWVPLSQALYGQDITTALKFLWFRGPQVVALLAILGVITTTIIIRFGIEKIKLMASVGGITMALLNIILITSALIVLIANDGQIVQPLNFISSPNFRNNSFFSQISFFSMIVFGFGGIELIGGLADKVSKPERTLPKALIISAIIITSGYIFGVLLIGIFTNWQSVLGGQRINIGNVTYIIMRNLGYVLAITLGFSSDTGLDIGMFFARFVGISMFISLAGGYIVVAYAPLKQIIDSTPEGLWPAKFTIRKNGIPIYALYTQSGIVITLIVIATFGGRSTSVFFNKLIMMTCISMTLPYMLLAIAFPHFKRNTEIKKPFEIFKTEIITKIVSLMVTITIGVVNIIAIIEPTIRQGLILDSLLFIAGPLFLMLLGFGIYTNYENASNNIAHN